MCHASLRKTLVAGLALILAPAAAAVALADPPGYLFQDFDQQSSGNASSNAVGAATSAQIAAVNRKADQAVGTARQALQEAQQVSASRASAVGDPTQWAALAPSHLSARRARQSVKKKPK
jgi:hypothetical protein